MKHALYTLLRRSSSRWLRPVRGANLVEYLLIVGVVALVGLGAYAEFGGTLKGAIKNHSDYVGKNVQPPKGG